MLPPSLFSLICASLCASTVTLVFAALEIGVSSALWIIPVAFISTFAYHAIILLLSNTEQPNSPRVFSAYNLGGAYLLIGLWTAVSAILLAYTVLLSSGRLKTRAHDKLWSMILSCIFSLCESALMGCIVWMTHKERMIIRYREKWKWRPGAGNSDSQWSIGR